MVFLAVVLPLAVFVVVFDFLVAVFFAFAALVVPLAFEPPTERVRDCRCAFSPPRVTSCAEIRCRSTRTCLRIAAFCCDRAVKFCPLGPKRGPFAALACAPPPLAPDFEVKRPPPGPAGAWNGLNSSTIRYGSFACPWTALARAAVAFSSAIAAAAAALT